MKPSLKVGVAIPAPLCGHGSGALQPHRLTARCRTCGSFWDLRSLAAGQQYDAEYPADRQHFDSSVGDCKIRTLRRWLTALGLDIRGRVVCEIGFGGGWCLAALKHDARRAFGVETVAEDIEHGVYLGLPRQDLLNAADLPERLEEQVDFWVLQDSFEHLSDPSGCLRWMVSNSAPGARALVVCPEAGCMSERLLGPLWPHRLRDHPFHWSAMGLESIFREHGFFLTDRFMPTKLLNGDILLSHVRHFGVWIPWRGRMRRLRLWFNIGEQGLLLQRGT